MSLRRDRQVQRLVRRQHRRASASDSHRGSSPPGGPWVWPGSPDKTEAGRTTRRRPTLATSRIADAQRPRADPVDTETAGAVFVRRTVRDDTRSGCAREVGRALRAGSRLTVPTAVASVRRRTVRIRRARRSTHQFGRGLLGSGNERLEAPAHPSVAALRILGTGDCSDANPALRVASRVRHLSIPLTHISCATFNIVAARPAWSNRATTQAVHCVRELATPPNVRRPGHRAVRIGVTQRGSDQTGAADAMEPRTCGCAIRVYRANCGTDGTDPRPATTCLRGEGLGGHAHRTRAELATASGHATASTGAADAQVEAICTIGVGIAGVQPGGPAAFSGASQGHSCAHQYQSR